MDDDERSIREYGMRAAEFWARAEALLPAWFTRRMTDDVWHFGVMLSTGKTLCIQCIDDVRVGTSGGVWVDATMDTYVPFWAEERRMDVMISPTSRTQVSINAAHIVAVFELADT